MPTIKSVEFDEQGRLVITLTDGTVLDPVELPKKEEHVHEFGELIVYTQGEMSCEDRIFYCVCKTCNQIEWKKGSYNDHAWSKSIIEPTCTSQGYVHQTCTICGKEEDVDFTPVLEHNWQGEYVIDKLCHWYKCNDCDAVKDKVEHTIDDSGYCTICNGAVGSTVGIIYDLSGDGTYYEVIGYEGTAKKYYNSKRI